MNNEEKQRIVEFFKVLRKVEIRELKKQLENEPEGFWVEGSWDCRRCGGCIESGWYTAHGILCPACKKKLLID